ncbi:MAG: hypothetical protein AB9Q22_10040 [Candidatus Reddybacter sp.]
MSNISVHPVIAANPVLLGHLQASTNSVATVRPGERYAVLVPQSPQATPSLTWLRAIGERALGNSK